ncbi:MAG: dUTP diphosphatase [Planctomycetota bacterium]
MRFVRLDARARTPAYQSELAAGMDLSACLPRGEIETETFDLLPGAIARVPTGIAIALPAGFEGQVRPRSGLAAKFGVTVPNAPGTIDADYRGELFVALINLGREPRRIGDGDRVAQLVVAPVVRAAMRETAALDETERGGGGFGSTGTGSETGSGTGGGTGGDA